MKDDSDEKTKIKQVMKKGWTEAITILVGAFVFVTAFAWRDFFQLIMKRVERRFPNKFPPLILSLTLACLLTIVSVVVIIASGYKK